MARITILKDDLLLALDDHLLGSRWLLDLTTGTINYLPDDSDYVSGEEFDKLYELLEQDPGRFLHIEPAPSRIGFAIMEAFAEDVRNPNLRNRLFQALNSRHPFRYFKNVLCDDERVRQEYFAFQAQEMLAYAHEWLEENDIDAEVVSSMAEEK